MRVLEVLRVLTQQQVDGRVAREVKRHRRVHLHVRLRVHKRCLRR
jgi:hypothetical protein